MGVYNHTNSDKYTLQYNAILSPSPVMKQMQSSLLSKPGPIPTPAVSLHNLLFFFQSRGGKMNWKYVVSGGLLLVLAGLIGAADYVST